MNEEQKIQAAQASEETKGKEAIVIRNWFDNQPTNKKLDILKPAFDEAHPTDASKKEAVKNYYY